MSTIALALIDIGRRIARWVVERIIKVGARRIGYYLLERAEAFRIRLKRAKTERAKKRLRGKIRRREKAGTWLVEWAVRIGQCVATETDALVAAAAKLPRVAKCEAA
jgi:hypothetical protein